MKKGSLECGARETPCSSQNRVFPAATDGRKKNLQRGGNGVKI